MKTYECVWCSADINREEKGAHVLKDGSMLCLYCFSDPSIHPYVMEPEEMVSMKNPCVDIKAIEKAIEPACPVVDMQVFEDVLRALRIKYSGGGVGVKGDYKLLRLFLDMSECIIKHTPFHKRIDEDYINSS